MDPDTYIFYHSFLKLLQSENSSSSVLITFLILLLLLIFNILFPFQYYFLYSLFLDLKFYSFFSLASSLFPITFIFIFNFDFSLSHQRLSLKGCHPWILQFSLSYTVCLNEFVDLVALLWVNCMAIWLFHRDLQMSISARFYSVVVQFLQRRSCGLLLGGVYKLPLTSWSRWMGNF